MLRQPIVAMMGHVDHGKTSLLDAVRGTAVAAKEAGGITQAIGASIIPMSTIKAVAGPLLTQLKIDLKIPGLLFIDTPGHAAFTNIRKRGGNLADIAVVVIDIMQGIQPQTCECIEILKLYKTPFVIALNKVDLIQSWRKQASLTDSFQKQQQSALTVLDTKLYEIVGKLFEMGINADRFDRVGDVTKQIIMIPCSAKTGEGIPELLMWVSGLAQRFLASNLEISKDTPAKGTVIEVKEEQGLGKVMDAIIYDGTLSVGDDIVVGGLDGPICCKVKALFLPTPLADMRDKRTDFESVQSVTAATGVRLCAPSDEDAVAGMPLRAASPETLEQVKEEVAKEVGEVLPEMEEMGIIAKADSLGSLEALVRLLKEADIPVSRASVGKLGKQDIAAAQSMLAKDKLRAVIIAFNIPRPDDCPVKIFASDVIYRAIEDYQAWMKGEQRNLENASREALPYPAKIKIMAGYIFRQSNPAVCGTEIQAGTLKPNVKMMKKDGTVVTSIRGIQKERENVEKAERNEQVAVSYSDVVVGRQIFENDVLYTYVEESDFRKLKDVKDLLRDDEKDVLREIAVIMRERNPVWGV